eukprot:Skav214940  [mRNA]  locus=scaffold2244:34530:41946:+ [translate_table: standard]
MFVKAVCPLIGRYDNVIAVELMNEPPLGGLPNCCTTLNIWKSILSFEGDVLAALARDPAIKAPIAIGNWSNAVEGESCFVSCLQCAGISKDAMEQFQSYACRRSRRSEAEGTPTWLPSRASQNRLILSFHWYVPPATTTFGSLAAAMGMWLLDQSSVGPSSTHY